MLAIGTQQLARILQKLLYDFYIFIIQSINEQVESTVECPGYDYCNTCGPNNQGLSMHVKHVFVFNK